MCVAVPARVVHVSGERGTVDVGGAFRVVSLIAVPGARPGDHVLVSMGMAVEVITESEASALATLWADLAASGERWADEGRREAKEG